ncbi:hypothetical protein DRP77_03030 [Candidatus Poribacteria bacterium]|nr:MAG: hypothetical protein DRP77_03030 [Candidatus Poribacteria bacterium]
MIPEPPPIPALIVGSYLALAVSHALEAAFLRVPGWLMRDDLIGAPWINLIGAPISLYYAFAIGTGLIHFGWHHAIIGLLFWLIPLTSVRIVGAAYVLDELIYYNEILVLPWHPASGGFDDLVARCPNAWRAGLGIAALGELILRRVLR